MFINFAVRGSPKYAIFAAGLKNEHCRGCCDVLRGHKKSRKREDKLCRKCHIGRPKSKTIVGKNIIFNKLMSLDSDE